MNGLKRTKNKSKIILACVVWILMGIFIASSATASVTSVSIGSVDTTLGESVTLPLMIKNAEKEISCATISLTYDNSIAKVISVSNSSFDSLVYNLNNGNGRTKIVVYQIAKKGLTGDIKVAEVRIEAIGVGSSPLNLEIETLKNNIGDEVAADAISGSFNVKSSEGSDGGSPGVAPSPSPSPPPAISPTPPINETSLPSPSLSPSPFQPEEPEITVVYVQVQIGNVTVEKGKSSNTSIKIKGVEGKGLSYADITLNYNPSIVEVEGAGGSDFDNFMWSMPSKGCLRMVAYQTGAEGLKGEIKFAEIKTKAVGKANESSEQGLEVKELTDNEGFPVHFEVKNGFFSIEGGEEAEEPSKAIPTLSILEIIAVIVGSYLVIRRRK